jgi:hypothetical protein
MYLNRWFNGKCARLESDDEVHFVLNQHAWLELYSASSQKQQSVGRLVAPLGHIILILNQPVYQNCLFLEIVQIYVSESVV